MLIKKLLTSDCITVPSHSRLKYIIHYFTGATILQLNVQHANVEPRRINRHTLTLQTRVRLACSGWSSHARAAIEGKSLARFVEVINLEFGQF